MREINKIWDLFCCLGLNMFIFVLWVYEMLISSDIPVEVTFKEVISMLCVLVLFLALYSLYARKTKYLLVNSILILIPLFLWFISLQQALKYHYHKYDTLVSIIGFSFTMLTFTQLLYRKFRSKPKI